MAKQKKLTQEEYLELQAQFDRTPGLGEGLVSGEHYMLIAVLNRLGYHPLSREQAIHMAEEMLSNGYFYS